MKKLKIALTVLLAFTASLALFACKDKTKDNGDSNLGVVFVDGTLTFTDVQTSGDWAGKLDQLKITAYYEGSEDEVTLTTDDVTFDNSAVEWGKVGTYKATVTPTERNEAGISTSFNVVIDHNFVAVDGQPGVSACSKDGATKTEKEIADTLDFGAWTSFKAYVGENNTAVKAFGASSRGETPVATAGRIDKGMTITLTAQVKTIGAGEAVVEGGTETGNANLYNVPLPGIADREYGASYVERFDTWGIYTINNLNGWTLAPYGKADTGTTEGTATKDSEELVAYAEGITATSPTFEAWTDVEFKWSYSSDCVITFTRTLLASGDSRIITMKLPERQFYETVLQGEFVRMKFSKISVVQDLKLTGVGDVTVPTAKNYVENEMIDPATFDVNVKYAGGLTGKADPAILTVYGNANANATLDTAEGWVNLSDEKLTSGIKAYKLHVQIAEDGFDALVPAAEAAKIVIAQNAVDHAIATDVNAFTSFGLEQLSFGSKDGKAIVTAVAGEGIECVATSLTAAQRSALTGSADAYTSYVAFSLYQNGPTQFTKGTVSVKSGTTDLPYYINVNGSGTKAEIVIALNATVDRSNIVISGIQPTDVLVDLSALGGLEVASTVTKGDLPINKGGEVTIEYAIDSSVTAEQVANTYRFTVNGISKNLKADGSNVTYSGTNGNITGIPGMSVAVSFTSGKLTATYTVPAIDPTNPLSYTFRLVNKSTGAVVASDTVGYDMYADGEIADGNLNDSVYVWADPTNSYLYFVVAYDAQNLWANQMSLPFAITMNAGAATPDAYKDYVHLQLQNLSWTFDANGAVRFANSVLDGFAAVNAYTFGGTFNNPEDTDHGIAIVVRVDATAVGCDKVAYTFKTNYSDDYYQVALPANGARAITIAEAEKQTSVTTITAGTCAVAGTGAFEVKSGSTVIFYDGAAPALGQHNFGAANTDGWATCTVCGALKYTGATHHGLEVAAVDGAAENGLTIAYKSYVTNTNASGDWTAHVINPYSDAKKTLSGLIITTENLDPWNNTVGLGSGHLFPSAGYLSPDYTLGSYKVDDANAKNVMIMVDKTLGIRYYVNGHLMIRYAVDLSTLNNAPAIKISDLVTKMLDYVEQFGFLFAGNYSAEETFEGKDLVVIAGTAGTDYVAASYYSAIFGETVDNVPDPSTPPTQIPGPSLAQGTDFTEQFTVGSADNTLGFTGTNPPVYNKEFVEAGQKLTLTGTMTSKDTAQWETLIVNLNGGNGLGEWSCFRTDGWLMNNTLSGDNLTVVGGCANADTNYADPEGTADEDKSSIQDTEYMDLIKNCDVTIVVDYSDFKTVVTTVTFSKDDVSRTLVCTLSNPLGTLASSRYIVGLGGEHVYLTLTGVYAE